MGSLADNLTQVIESRLSDFATRFSEENSSSVEQAVKRARREHYTCKRKGNQQQLDHSLQVLDRPDEASGALKQKSYEKVKVARLLMWLLVRKLDQLVVWDLVLR